MNTLKIEQRDPNDFKPGKFHPALKLIPELANDSDEFLSLAAAVKKCGFIRPILVDGEGRIVDDHSRSLWRAAQRWQLTTVPVKVVPTEEASLALIHSLKDVRHMTKSAIAYLALPIMENEVKASLARHREKLAKGQYIAVVAGGDNSGIPPAPTLDKLAEDLGICRDLLYRSRTVHTEFESKTIYTFDVVGGPADGSVKQCTLKEYFEPRILQSPAGGEHEQNRPMGLGAVISAIAGIRATKDQKRPDSRGQLELALDGFGTLATRLFKLPDGAMTKSIANWFDKHAENLSDEQLDQMEELGETIRAQAKQLRKNKA
jgi:hypothetical protein